MKCWLALSVGLLGCASPSPFVTSAGRGDLAAHRVELESRLRAGNLGRAEARDMARATAEGEIRRASGERALRRVLEAEACVHEVASALRARSRGKDPAAAEALVVLYEAGEISRGTALDHEDDADAAFRRVAVRALDQPGDHERRAAYFVHSDGALRIMALRASMIAQDADDVPALRERARLDPEPDARSNAIRALALLDPPPEDLAAFLASLAKDDSTDVTSDIVIAWALSPTFEHGGRDALVQLLQNEKTKPEQRAVVAHLVLRTHPDLASFAATQLIQVLHGSSVPARLLALRAPLPASAPLLEVVRELAQKDGPTEVGIAASEALLGAAPAAKVPDKERDAARARLYEIAKTDGLLGSQARAALARAGDRRVQAWLEHDLSAKDPVRKLMAARGLAALDVAGRATPLLADPDASVRTRAACVILNASTQPAGRR